MLPSSTVENYLKAIHEAQHRLTAERDLVPMGQLSSALGVVPGTATTMVKTLAESGLMIYEPYSGVRLTAAGAKLAAAVLRRHRLVELFLVRVMGMNWDEVHDEAEQLEHAVSADFERRLIEKLGAGDACPHGNRALMDKPEDRRRRGLRPLDEAQATQKLKVVSVFERDRKLLEYLEGLGVRPGVLLEVMARNYDETLTLRVNGRSMQLGRPAASKVWVQSPN